MPAWQEKDVQSNGIQMHTMRTGGDKPPVVLAHGVTDDGLCWTPVAEALAPDYDVIMVDARGHGRSEAPESGYDQATLAADLNGAILALGLQRPFVLGHSLGAGTALALAGLYPATPAGILLEDPPDFWLMARAGPPRSTEQRPGPESWLGALKNQTREQLIAEARAQNPTWSEVEFEPWADAKLRFSLHAVQGIFAAITQPGLDWSATLRRITCPALVIKAEPTRSALREEGLAALQALVPQLKVVTIPGAGHNIHREQFARYMEVIRAFLAEHAGTAGGRS